MPIPAKEALVLLNGQVTAESLMLKEFLLADFVHMGPLSIVVVPDSMWLLRRGCFYTLMPVRGPRPPGRYGLLPALCLGVSFAIACPCRHL